MNEHIVLIRALWALGIIVGGLSIYWLLNRIILYRAQQNGAPQAVKTLFTRQGVPAILYFTTTSCVTCKAAQRPALRRLQERMGEGLEVVEVDAQERPDLASRWGVLSVPTTFVIDEQGQLRYVNHGVARLEKLIHQLSDIHSNDS